MIRTPLGYPGSKNKCIDQILELIPDGIEDWRECFFGGGSITLSYLQSPKCTAKTLTVCELSPEVWAFWQGTKLHAPEAAEIAKRWFTEKAPTQLLLNSMDPSDPEYAKIEEEAIAEGRELWKWTQEVDCSKLTLAERAARFFIVNKISFSSMSDSGSMSKDNFKGFKLEMTQKMIDIQPLLQKIDIRNVSFEELFKDVDKDKTFIMMDPPYITQGQSSPMYGRNGNTHTGFPHDEYARLTKELECRWLVTYDDSIRVRKLFQGCYVKPFKITYTMAGKTSEDALAGEELFIANYDITEKPVEDLFDML